MSNLYRLTSILSFSFPRMKVVMGTEFFVVRQYMTMSGLYVARIETGSPTGVVICKHGISSAGY